MWGCIRCLSQVSLLPAVWWSALPLCGEAALSTSREAEHYTAVRWNRCSFGCPFLLAVGNVKQYNNQLPCQCNALLLHMGGSWWSSTASHTLTFFKYPQTTPHQKTQTITFFHGDLLTNQPANKRTWVKHYAGMCSITHTYTHTHTHSL